MADGKMVKIGSLFLGAAVGTCAALSIYLYRDKALQARMKRQIDSMMDMTDQMIGFSMSMFESLTGKESNHDDDVIEVKNQWAAIDEARKAN